MQTMRWWCRLLVVLVMTVWFTGCNSTSRRSMQTGQAITDFKIIEQSNTRAFTTAERAQIQMAVEKYLANLGMGQSGSFDVRITFNPEKPGVAGEWVVVRISKLVVDRYAIVNGSAAVPYRGYDPYFDRYAYGGWSGGYYDPYGFGFWGNNYYDPFYSGYGYYSPGGGGISPRPRSPDKDDRRPHDRPHRPDDGEPRYYGPRNPDNTGEVTPRRDRTENNRDDGRTRNWTPPADRVRSSDTDRSSPRPESRPHSEPRAESTPRYEPPAQSSPRYEAPVQSSPSVDRSSSDSGGRTNNAGTTRENLN